MELAIMASDSNAVTLFGSAGQTIEESKEEK
jgi:hypothetical protein